MSEPRIRFIGECGPLFASLAKAQAEFGEIHRDKTVKVTTKAGGSYTFNYAPLENILAATLPSLNKYEVFFTQPLAGKTLYTILAHSSGCRMEMEADLAGNGDIKEFGGEITYLRRYCGTTALGLASEEDDDGNMAAGDHREVSDRSKPQLDTAKAEAEEAKISAFIDKCGDQAKLSKLRSDIPGYALFEQQKTALIKKIDDKLAASGDEATQVLTALLSAINEATTEADCNRLYDEAEKLLTTAGREQATNMKNARITLINSGGVGQQNGTKQTKKTWEAFLAKIPNERSFDTLNDMLNWVEGRSETPCNRTVTEKTDAAREITRRIRTLEEETARQAEPVNA